MRRAALTLVVLLVLPALASAHGGTTVLSGGNAAYDLTVLASDVTTPEGATAVDLTAYPIRRGNGAPDLGADVRFSIDGEAAIRARRNGDGVEAVVPVSSRGQWRSWTIVASVRGGGGELRITGEPVARQEDSLPPALVPVGVVLAVLAIGYALLIQRRRRAQEPA